MGRPRLALLSPPLLLLLLLLGPAPGAEIDRSRLEGLARGKVEPVNVVFAGKFYSRDPTEIVSIGLVQKKAHGSSDGASSHSHSFSSTHLGAGNSNSSVKPIGSVVTGLSQVRLRGSQGSSRLGPAPCLLPSHPLQSGRSILWRMTIESLERGEGLHHGGSPSLVSLTYSILHLPGADPELVLLNFKYEELERIPLSDMIREEINQLVQDLGFYRKESPESPVPEEFQLAPAQPPAHLRGVQEGPRGKEKGWCRRPLDLLLMKTSGVDVSAWKNAGTQDLHMCR
ncbi:UNVERIFIED_CONTAM: hypothetical protein K2H54_027813 [Gekko kuhli]